MSNNITEIVLSAKCGDLFNAEFFYESGDGAGEHEGSVPSFLHSHKHDNDYIQLNIDLETGQILNWKKPSQQELKNLLRIEEG